MKEKEEKEGLHQKKKLKENFIEAIGDSKT